MVHIAPGWTDSAYRKPDILDMLSMSAPNLEDAWIHYGTSSGSLLIGF